MSLVNIPEAAKRVLIRETAGRALREKAARADNTEKIAELVTLRAAARDNLQPDDFREAGRAWGLDPAMLHALADAESSGAGFDANGRLIINVECHAFSAATEHAFDVTHPHLSYPRFIKWERGKPPPKGMQKHPYLDSQDERWQRFALQAELDVEAACCALSGGRFQPLIGVTPADLRKGREPGWKELGFMSAEGMFRRLYQSERSQLEVLYLFLRVHDLIDAFKRRDWRTITARYNGTGNVEVYSAKIETNYHKRRTTTYA